MNRPWTNRINQRLSALIVAAGLAMAGGAKAAPVCLTTKYVPTVLPQDASPPWQVNGSNTLCCTNPATYGQTCDTASTQCIQIVQNELVITKSGDLVNNDHSLFLIRPDCGIGTSSSTTLTSKARYRPDVPSPGNGYSPQCGAAPDSTGPSDNMNFYADNGVLAISDGTKIGAIIIGRVTDPRFGFPGAGPSSTFIGVPTFNDCGPRSEPNNFVGYAPLDATVTHTYRLNLRPGTDFAVYVDGSAVPSIVVPYALLPSAAKVNGLSVFVVGADRGVATFDSIDTSVCDGYCPGQCKPAPPTVVTKDLTYCEDDKAFRVFEEQLEKAQCSEKPVLPFKASDCVVSATSACQGAIDLNDPSRVSITKVEFLACGHGDDDEHEAQLKQCAKFGVSGSSATLPIEGSRSGSYRVTIQVTDATHNTASAVCNVTVRDHCKAKAKDADDKDAPAVCASACQVCVGTGCGQCPSPLVACKDAQRCAKAVSCGGGGKQDGCADHCSQCSVNSCSCRSDRD